MKFVTRWAPTVGLIVLAGSAWSCAPAEDPARVQLRDRLHQETRLSDTEVQQVIGEVSRSVAGRSLLIKDQAASRALEGEQRGVVLSMLGDPVGVYDEGLRREGDAEYRVLNGPARSDNAEIEATQRLWIDVQSFLPLRYRYSYAFPGYGDYEYELTPNP